ncbi:MAG: type II toxin-antitoxin system RelE/ParE family toxin [Azospirillaceae bacterium]
MNASKTIHARFFQQQGGSEPVRDWLLTLSPGDRKAVGDDIRTAEFGWPVGMPLCRPIGKGLWEVRTNISDGRIARVLFCVHGGGMVLLHGFIKKTRKTPQADLDLARMRMRGLI